MSTIADTSASDFMLKTNNNAEKLKEHHRKYFHTTIARGLLITKRAIPDTHTAITYLYTIVKEPRWQTSLFPYP